MARDREVKNLLRVLIVVLFVCSTFSSSGPWAGGASILPRAEAEKHVESDAGFSGNLRQLATSTRDWYSRSRDGAQSEFVPREILVKFRQAVSPVLEKGVVRTDIQSIDELNRRFGVKGIGRLFSRVYKLTLPDDADIPSIVRRYEAEPTVEYAEPNDIYHTCAVPNDPNYTQQWAHQVIQSGFAWNRTTGNSTVIIAVVDTGVDWDHRDLAANIWNNTDEYPIDGKDTDGNGYIDDIRGWDFADKDNDPMDFDGHGTHCSGIAAAVANNTIGVAGVSWNCKIMPVRAGSAFGFTWDNCALAIRYAANNNANIISMSWGGTGDSSTVHEAVKYAYNRGVLLVAAAGNEATSQEFFPAAYDEVVAVTATDEYDDPAWFTSFGNWTEVAAPGVAIYSTVCDDSYAYYSGTSMACPNVAGVAALIWSRFPNMTRDQVRVQLRCTTDDLGDPGRDDYYGYGRVNARWAVRTHEPDHDLRLWGLKTPSIAKPGDTVAVNSSVLNFGKNNESNITVRLLVNGSVVDNASIGFLASHTWASVSRSWTPQREGRYNVTCHVVPVQNEDVTENNAVSAWVLVRVEEVIHVPGDYPAIQGAVHAANPGYTIKVSPGTYYEHVTVNKFDLTLVGEDGQKTIIDGCGYENAVVLAKDDANITGFCIRNIGSGYYSDIFVASNNNSIVHNIITNSNNIGILLNTPACNNLITGNTITKVWVGVRAFCSSNNTISQNTISDTSLSGIELVFSSSYNTVIANRMTNCCVGIRIPLYSSYNSISCNVVSNNDVGIGFGPLSGLSNTVFCNEVSNNTVGVRVDSWESRMSGIFYHNNFIDNTDQVDIGLPQNQTWDDGYPSGGNYWSDYNGTDLYSGPYQNVTGDDGIGDTPYVIDANNTDTYPLMQPYRGSVRNLNTGQSYPTIQRAISNASEGDTIFVLSGTYYEHVVVNKTISLVGENRDTTIIDGNGTGSPVILAASFINFSGFTVRRGSRTLPEAGIWIGGQAWDKLRGIRVRDNNIADNAIGVRIQYSVDCIILDSNIENNRIGIWLGYQATNNNIINNIIENNGDSYKSYGCYLVEVSNNTIYHNSFINNTAYSIGRNSWDDDYPSGGNYWSDYNGTDLYRGPYQNETGGDGIGDAPRVTDEGNLDRYPLMVPWPLNGTLTIPYGATAVYPQGPSDSRPGWHVNVTVYLQNRGAEAETFNVTAYYGSQTIGNRVINLPPETREALTFTWNPTGVAPCKYDYAGGHYVPYAITVNVSSPALGETTWYSGTVTVRFPGDGSGPGDKCDGVADIFDLVLLGLNWYRSYPNYDWRADWNGDGKVDIFDLGLHGRFEVCHDVAITGVTASYKTSVVYPTWRGPVRISVTARNRGGFTEAFAVTALQDGQAIGAQNLTLPPLTEQVVTFNWTPPSLPGYPGNRSRAWPYPRYNISASATLVLGDVDPENNARAYGVVEQRWPGDASGDGHVNDADKAILNAAWYKAYPDPGYDCRADFNGDGRIDIIDLMILNMDQNQGPLDP